MTAIIEVNGLTKSYGSKRGITNVSFQVEAGEVFGLLGPNGAGKTTALRILATILQPTSGSVRVFNFDVVKQADYVRHSIGFVSNNTAIYDRMSAWELVEYFGRLYALPDDHLYPRMEKIFRTLQMEDFKECPGAKMSTGMKQKTSIARALIHDPPVLIFDEASLGLDVMVARALQSIVMELRYPMRCRFAASECHPNELASVVTGFCTTCAIPACANPAVLSTSVVQKPDSTETSSVGRAWTGPPAKRSLGF